MTADTPGLRQLRHASATDRRILLISTATVVSRLLAKVAQLAFLVVAARLFSIEEFAGYSYLLVLAVTFSMLADTGVALAASREISAGRRPADEVFWSSAPVIGLGGAIGGLAVLAFGLADSAPGSSGVALLLTCLFVVVNTLFNFAATTLRGIGRSVFEALLQGAGALVFLGAGGLALALGAGIVPVLAILLGKEALSAAVAFGALRADVGAPRGSAPHLWRRLFRLGIQLGLASAALALVSRASTFVLANTGTPAELAWFSAGQRLADAVLLLATTSGFALLPSLTLLLETEPSRAWQLLGRVLTAAAAGGVLVGALAVALAPQVVDVAFGGDFGDAVEPTRVLMIGCPAYALVGIAWFALVALGRERVLLVASAAAAALTLALSLVLVPDEGDVGAAIALVGGLAALAVALTACLLRVRP